MLLVGSGIDAMVATFRQVGVFKPKEPVSVQQSSSVVQDFINNLKSITGK